VAQKDEPLTRFVRALASDPHQLHSLMALNAELDYTTPDVDPASLSYTQDDWDGSAAVAGYPDAEEADLRPNFVLVPESEEERDAKANFGLPFRDSHEGQANMNAVTAALAAINGARGGLTGVTQDEAREAFDLLVEMGVEGGLYEDADEAPDFSPPEGNLAGQSAWDFIEDTVEAETGSVQASLPFSAQVSAQTDGEGDAPLTGVIWATGVHSLHINGEPVQIKVDEESLRNTYERLQERVQAGEVSLGTDHFGSLKDVPVAEEAGLLEIGKVTGVALSDDGQKIVMTDSELTSEDARQAYQNGVFDDVGFSIDGKVRVFMDDERQPMMDEEEDAILAEAHQIDRVDLVETGAVEGARNGNVPPVGAAAEIASRNPRQPAPYLSSMLDTAAEAVSEPAQAGDALGARLQALIRQSETPEDELISLMADAADRDQSTVRSHVSGEVQCPPVGALMAYNRALNNTEGVNVDPDDLITAAEADGCDYSDSDGSASAPHGGTMTDFNSDNYDSVEEALQAASSAVEDKDEQIQDLEAELADKKEQAEAFEEIAAAHGFEDLEEVQAQDVIDEHTQELRREVAELEASLPKEDTSSDEVEERVDELAGSSPRELRLRRGDLSAAAMKSEQARERYTKGVAAEEQETDGSSGGSGQDAEDEKLAASVLTPSEMLQVQDADISASEFLEREHDVDVSKHDTEQDLQAAVVNGGGE
jgi:hypothetical protein